MHIQEAGAWLVIAGSLGLLLLGTIIALMATGGPR